MSSFSTSWTPWHPIEATPETLVRLLSQPLRTHFLNRRILSLYSSLFLDVDRFTSFFKKKPSTVVDVMRPPMLLNPPLSQQEVSIIQSFNWNRKYLFESIRCICGVTFLIHVVHFSIRLKMTLSSLVYFIIRLIFVNLHAFEYNTISFKTNYP